MRYPKDLLAELRRQGFKRTYETNGVGQECAIYEKVVGDRKLDLQLWGDGGHRVSHFHTARTLHGCMCTHPTDFSTLEEMKAAIQTELTRKDHSRHTPLKKGTMVMSNEGVFVIA